MRIEPAITGVLIEFTALERQLLTTLLAQYDELVHEQLDDADLAEDPALARLFPNAYPDDDEAAAEFRTYTREGLVERKSANSGLISAALVASPEQRLSVERDDAERWLPALTDLRLVLAERLGIRHDDDPLPDDELADVYAWLGELQWSLIAALDPESAEAPEGF
ncbi:DUF2017 family protein [Lysinimonas soli]|uniref:DUF2017 family protein n=1 Tax=Lysinimonas soli TaxID=1074233 RepID=A0ABW0NN97_9MICO